LFSSFSGPLEFEKVDMGLISSNSSFIIPQNPRKKDLLKYCESFRVINGINSDDFVVLLTSLQNQENWFSHFDSARNIFVQTCDGNFTLKQNLNILSHNR
jgi:inhibitor of KinA sporulation pathway (predicted exonuclease)